MDHKISEYWFIIQNERVLLHQNNNDYVIPTASDISSLKPLFLRQHLMGEINAITCHAAELPADVPPNPAFEFIPLRKAFEILGPDWYGAASKAYSIISWDRNHQFCGRCGNPTEHKAIIFERVCTVCGLSFYPRISPSIIVLIHKGDEILMARSPHFAPGIFALIAGFVEVGESLEAAVHREVKEEVGVNITNLRYFSSQPWPFPDSLMIGFFADYVSGDIKIDKNEIEAADWYHYQHMPGRPSSRISIAQKLLDQFIAERCDDGRDAKNA